MKKRKPIVGMSLKIYQNTIQEATDFAERIRSFMDDEQDVDLFLFPSLGTLFPVAQKLAGSSIAVGAQNIAPEANGAYTGEFSIESLIDMGGTYVEIGHSERRYIFQESNELIQQKVALTLKEGLVPVLCIGEPKKNSPYSEIEQFLEQQIARDLKAIPLKKLEEVVLAYEPVWAIGAAEAATTKHVEQTFEIIRDILSRLFGEEVAKKIRIIYGGSVSKKNVVEMAKIDTLDGVFIGRFGHNPENYRAIVETIKKEKHYQ
ncbi:MAG: triose-phosphate isomerase [Desemzia incerta]